MDHIEFGTALKYFSWFSIKIVFVVIGYKKGLYRTKIMFSVLT
jgi:hypothetical protein